MVRSCLDNDPEFNANHGSMVAKGDLLDDNVVIPIAEAKWNQVLATANSEVYLDGIPRNPSQLRHFLGTRHLTRDNTLVLILNASRTTCRQRFNHRNALKPDGERTDIDSFEHRFDIHERDLPEIKEICRNKKMHVVPVDADQELENVAPIVIALAQAFWKRHGGARQVSVAPSRPVEIMTSRQRIMAAMLSSKRRYAEEPQLVTA